MPPESAQEIERIRRVHELRGTDPSIRARDNLSHPGNQLMVKEARNHLTQMLTLYLAKPVATCRVLDVGCGYGELLNWFHQMQGVPAEQLIGIDLLPSRIAEARARFPALHFEQTNGERLDFPDKAVDLVSVFTVFSSILEPAVSAQLADDIRRILVPGGAVIWYDMRYLNPWNRNLRAVSRKEINKFFPKYATHLQSITLLPPLARRLGWLPSESYAILARIRFLQTHLIGLLIKP